MCPGPASLVPRSWSRQHLLTGLFSSSPGSPLGSQHRLVQTQTRAGMPPGVNPSLAFHDSLDKDQEGAAVPFYKDVGDLIKDDNRPMPRILVLYPPSQVEEPSCVSTAVQSLFPVEGQVSPAFRCPWPLPTGMKMPQTSPSHGGLQGPLPHSVSSRPPAQHAQGTVRETEGQVPEVSFPVNHAL